MILSFAQIFPTFLQTEVHVPSLFLLKKKEKQTIWQKILKQNNKNSTKKYEFLLC